MTLTALELRTLRYGIGSREERSRLAADDFANQLVFENQDHNCTVDEDVAFQLMLEMRNYALLKEDATDHIGMTLTMTSGKDRFDDEPLKADELRILYISKEPNANGRYEVTACTESLAEYLTR